MDLRAHQLYAKLRAMADNPAASPNERRIARKRMAAMLDAHGPQVDETDEFVVDPKSPYDVQLFVHTAATHGLVPVPGVKELKVRGPSSHVTRVRADYEAYSSRLHDVLMLATFAEMKGLGIYHDLGVDSRAPEEKPAFHINLREYVTYVHQSVLMIAAFYRRPDYTLPALPAKGQTHGAKPQQLDPFGGWLRQIGYRESEPLG